MPQAPDYPLRDMLARIETIVKDFPKAAMFELADRGYSSLFEQLVSCIISIRTLDEQTMPISLRLFAKASTPAAMLRLSKEELAGLLEGCQFPGQKAETILGIARFAQEGGGLPSSAEALMALKGVGIKCTNLSLGVAAGVPAISVDAHVHRVVNRWGIIHTKTAEKTTVALEELVPKDLWIDINRLLMPFGKHWCTWRLPRCATCPVLSWCRQIGVGKHR